MNVFDFALDMEAAGKDYYENLARAASLPGLKTIFNRLAEDEQRHYEIFQDLKAGNPAKSMPESTILDAVRNVFVQLPRDSQALKDVAESLAAYRHAMKLEADSFRLYEEAAQGEDDPGVKALLLKIAAEEHKHYTILENVYQLRQCAQSAPGLGGIQQPRRVPPVRPGSRRLIRPGSPGSRPASSRHKSRAPFARSALARFNEWCNRAIFCECAVDQQAVVCRCRP